MYHLKSIIKFVNGRPKHTGCYKITDDNGLIVESTASEETIKYYESLNKEERKRKKVNKMNRILINNDIIHDIDTIRRVEDIGFSYDGDVKYSTKLFIIFDSEMQEEVEKKCFYFLAGPISRNQMENILNRMTAKEFDEYFKNPNYAKFRLVPAHIERI